VESGWRRLVGGPMGFAKSSFELLHVCVWACAPSVSSSWQRIGFVNEEEEEGRTSKSTMAMRLSPRVSMAWAAATATLLKMQ
jgi:hypothetical protein